MDAGGADPPAADGVGVGVGVAGGVGDGAGLGEGATAEGDGIGAGGTGGGASSDRGRMYLWMKELIDDIASSVLWRIWPISVTSRDIHWPKPVTPRKV